MSRGELAYLLMLLTVGSALIMWICSLRYSRYRRSVLRGNRGAKPAWKPFWMI